MRILNIYNTKQNRRELRKNMPKAELLLWAKLKNKQCGHKFRRQFGFGNFIVDFYCPAARLAIEIDGDSHFNASAEMYDNQRQKLIESLGIKFLRFTNCDIYNSMEGVVAKILEHLPPLTPP